MKRHKPAEHTARAIVVTFAFFGSLALLGWNAGVFAKLDVEELWVLGGFVVGFAVLTYAVDSQVRATTGRAAAAVRGVFNNPVAGSGYPRGGSSRPGGFSRIE
ncbi:MAG: hypothetical protein M3R58_17875 [Pseudomonadota bacterium]|nr:hypothetical protein [Pseudomonadota bacterium]